MSSTPIPSFKENVSRLLGLLAFVCGNLVNRASRKQSHVATSTTEGQIPAVQNVVNETEYIRMLVKELGFNELLKDSNTILNPNLSEIASFASKEKHEKNKQHKNRMNLVICSIEEKLLVGA